MNPINWLLDHFQFVIIVVFALASWLKHRAEQKKAAAEEEAERARRGGMADDDEEEMFSPEENWRMPQAAPEPPSLPRRGPPPLRVDMAEMDAVLRRQQDMQERLRQIKESKATVTTGDAAATRARISAAGRPALPGRPENTGLRASLRDAEQTRRAVVLREILGPPLGLR